jgi:uncharacterized protein (TIGR01370 family)
MDRLSGTRNRVARALLRGVLGVVTLATTVGCVYLLAVALDTQAATGPSTAPSAGRHERGERLRAVCSWAPVFGGAHLRRAGIFDLVVVDAVRQRDGRVETSASQLRRLHTSGALVLAYISVGTVESWRHYAPDVPRSGTLGAVEGWAGERYVDARKRGWRALMAREARSLAAAGLDGLYLDNLDVAELHPETAGGVVQLVETLASAVPDLLLVAQNGLAVADRLPIDGLAHEDVYWRWDGRYRRSTEAERAALLPRLRALREQGLPVFTLDYAPKDFEGAREALASSLADGFRPAVSVLDLDRLPHGVPKC